MRKLFLSSAGIVPETKNDFLKLLGKDPKDVLVAFIPTAAGPEKDKSYVQWTIDQIQQLGMKSEKVDLVDENEKSLESKLSKCEVIIMNGGNTFYLLEWVKKSGFDKVIPKLLDQGKIYIGISAGSYVACPNIEAGKWKHLGDSDVIGKSDLSALNLVDFLIVAHYSGKYKQDVENGVKTTSLPVVALTDKQAIVVEGDKYRIVGEGERNFFNGFEEK